jgi:hypothetical protein
MAQQLTIIDSIMGSCKSMIAFETAQKSSKNVIFSSEYLSELKRAEDYGFTQPDNDGEYDTKLASLENLIGNGGKIAITHSLFRKLIRNKELLTLTLMMGFELIIDETVNFISMFDGIKGSNLDFLLVNGHINIDYCSRGKVSFTGIKPERMKESAFSNLFTEIDYLYARRGERPSLIVVEPAEWIQYFDMITFLTYNFEGDMLHAWCQFHNIKTEIRKCPALELLKRSQAADLITYLDEYDKEFYKESLTRSWYDRQDQKGLSRVGKLMTKIGDAHSSPDPEKFGYTYPQELCGTQRNGIQSRRFSHSVCLVDGVYETCQRDSEERDKGNSAHVSQNARGMNNFRHKTVMVHALDVYQIPIISSWLTVCGITFSNDTFAVNQFLQWFWRCAIRDGKAVKLSILSKRMRRLFYGWLVGV